jgi:hypothetical protein
MMRVPEQVRISRKVVISLPLLATIFFPAHSDAVTRPCRGFGGASYTRERLLALCGKPDEVVEQETKRTLLWRYKGYPFVVVGSESANSRILQQPRDLFRGTSSGLNSASTSHGAGKQVEAERGTVVRESVSQELFLSILNEASSVPD